MLRYENGKILYVLFLNYLYTFSVKYVVVGTVYFVNYLLNMSFYCLIEDVC